MKCTMCGSAAGCDGCPIGTNFFVASPLAALAVGQRGTIQRLAAREPADLRKLLALGLLPGVELEVERRWPAVVLRLDYASVALDAGLAEAVLVSAARLAGGVTQATVPASAFPAVWHFTTLQV